MTKYEMFKPYRELLLKEFNNVLAAAYNAEEEVLNANQYWKSSDTLNRLLISIRRSKQRLDRKYVEIAEEIRKAEAKEPKAAEVDTAQMDRFERREELMNPDPFEKGNWNKI